MTCAPATPEIIKIDNINQLIGLVPLNQEVWARVNGKLGLYKLTAEKPGQHTAYHLV
jgi:hypothetical protein